MKGLGMKKNRIFWALGILLLAGAGGAAALFLSSRRDVTTTSEAAYEAYREAMRNENRFYFKEARVGFAKAPANFTDLAWRRRVTARRVFFVIREGVHGTPMPAWNWLSTDETWDLVAYLLSLGPSPAP
jgi:hypothetical protein